MSNVQLEVYTFFSVSLHSFNTYSFSLQANEDKTAPLKNSIFNSKKLNNFNDDSNANQKRDIIRNPNDNLSFSHSVNDNNLSSSHSQSDLPEGTSVSSSLPVVSKAISLGTVGSEQNNSAAAAKGSKVGTISTPTEVTSVVTSKKSVNISQTVASYTANSTETMVTSEASANDIGTIISNKSSDTNATLTSSNRAGLISSISKLANFSASSESLQSNKNTLSAKTSKPNVKETPSTVSSGKLISQANDQSLASNSLSALVESERSSRGASSSHSRLREAAVIHPPENILSAAPCDTRADSADSSSSTSEGDLQRLASSVLKGVVAPLGRWVISMTSIGHNIVLRYFIQLLCVNLSPENYTSIWKMHLVIVLSQL